MTKQEAEFEVAYCERQLSEAILTAPRGQGSHWKLKRDLKLARKNLKEFEENSGLGGSENVLKV
jgi:hypothetical protein